MLTGRITRVYVFRSFGGEHEDYFDVSEEPAAPIFRVKITQILLLGRLTVLP